MDFIGQYSMFILSAYQRSSNQEQPSQHQPEQDLSEVCCISACNLGLRLGAQAAYNAAGYAILASNSLMTPQLTMTAAVQSGVIGAAVILPPCVCMQVFNTESRFSPECTLTTGSCTETLDSVIFSLAGAGIQGLFVNNVTTPAYMAASGATGAAAVIGGVVASIVVVGGVTFFCVELYDNRQAFLPTNCCPNFTARDLVYPCELGLSICSREQMKAFIDSCAQCCPKPRAAQEQDYHSRSPQPQTMTRDDIPVAQVFNPSQQPMYAIPINEVSSAPAIDEAGAEIVVEKNNAAKPSAPTLAMI